MLRRQGRGDLSGLCLSGCGAAGGGSGGGGGDDDDDCNPSRRVGVRVCSGGGDNFLMEGKLEGIGGASDVGCRLGPATKGDARIPPPCSTAADKARDARLGHLTLAGGGVVSTD
jgi:hypothetical protein